MVVTGKTEFSKFINFFVRVLFLSVLAIIHIQRNNILCHECAGMASGFLTRFQLKRIIGSQEVF